MPVAFLQALDQKEPEDLIRLGGSFKEALIRQWAQCCSVVAAAAVFEKRALVRCAMAKGPVLRVVLLVHPHTELNGTGFRL